MDTHLTASIFCEPYNFTATIINISEKGVCVHTTMCFPCETKCKLLIPESMRTMKIEVVVKHIIKKEGVSDTMGFEVLNPSLEYIEFVKDLTNYC